MIGTQANNKKQIPNFLNLLKAAVIFFFLKGNQFFLVCLNKWNFNSQLYTEPKIFPKLAVPMRANDLYSLAYNRPSKVNSFDSWRIVAAKKDIKKRERKDIIFFYIWCKLIYHKILIFFDIFF